MLSDEELAWVADHLPSLRRGVAGKQILLTFLGIAFVLGLAANIGGFLLAANEPDTLVALVADLVTNLGIALWTGSVLVVFVQILPDMKRRAAIRELDEYERVIRERRLSDAPPNLTGKRTDA